MQSARVHLLTTLYFNHPALLAGMRAVQTELAKLDSLSLLSDFQGRTFGLSKFASRNVLHMQERCQDLLTLHRNVQVILLQVCDQCLAELETPNAGFPGHEFAESSRKSSNFHLFDTFIERERALATADTHFLRHSHLRMAPPSANDKASPSKGGGGAQRGTIVQSGGHPLSDNSLDEIRWTLAAIRRRQCALLSRFVLLVEFMQLDVFFALVLRSIHQVRDALLSGANARHITRLTDRRDYLIAFYRTLDGQAKQNGRRVSGLFNGDADTANNIAPDKPRQLQLTKQQTKRFLRSSWAGKFTPTSSDDPSAASDSVWMESKMEAFFFRGLAMRCGDQADAFTLDDFLDAVENFIAKSLVLPEFQVANCSIFDREDANALTDPSSHNDVAEVLIPTAGSTRTLGVQDGEISSQDIQSISFLAPIPLFEISLELFESRATTTDLVKQARRPLVRASEHAHEMLVLKPPLNNVVHVVRDLITDFVVLFRKIPPLSDHPGLRAVIDFAEDIRSYRVETPPPPPQRNVIAMNTLALWITDHKESDESKDSDEDESDDESKERKSTFDRLTERIGQDHAYAVLRIEIDALLSKAFQGASEFMEQYNEILRKHMENEHTDFRILRSRFQRGEYSLGDMTRDVESYNQQIRDLNALSTTQNIAFLHFNMDKLKRSLVPSPVRCLEVLQVLLPELAHEKCVAFLDFIRASSKLIEKPKIVDLDEFSEYLLHLKQVQDDVQEKDYDLTFLHDFFAVLAKLTFAIPTHTSEVFELCEPEFENLKAEVNDAMSRRDMDINEYAPILQENIRRLQVGIEHLKSGASDKTMNATDSNCQDARTMSNQLEKNAEALALESQRLVRIQQIFAEFTGGNKVTVVDFSELPVISNELTLKNDLWVAVCVAEDYLAATSDETLRELDLGKMKTVVQHVQEVINRLQKSSLRFAAMQRLEESKSIIEGLAPIIRDLRNENLEERHWAKLEHKIGCAFSLRVRDDSNDTEKADGEADTGADKTAPPHEVRHLDLPFKHLLTIQAVTHAVTIHQVSEEATAEAAISKSFLSVSMTWEIKEIPTALRKDREGREIYCIGNCQEVCSLLEESEVLLRVMDFSSYARVIQGRLSKMLNDLRLAKETMELLIVAQQKWDYMQRLVSPDFLRAFPEQSKQLHHHDASWKAVTDGVAKRPLCFPFATNPDNKPTLQSIIRGFESVAKSLEDHLELKRQVFPAFFKLSNVELATLISKSRDVYNIQQFLYQCFDNVARINFGTRDACQDILSVASRSFPQAELISMGKNLKARGPTEQWLFSTEKRLIEQLRRATRDAVALVSDLSSIRSRSASQDLGAKPDESYATLVALPLQCIVLADKVVRSDVIDKMLKDGETSETVLQRLQTHQESLSELVQRAASRETDRNLTAKMTPRELTLYALLTLNHLQYRDAVADTVSTGATRRATTSMSGDIAWDLQLKYKLDDSASVGQDIHVEMNSLKVAYGFHYVNPHAETVLCPASLRFLFSMFACIRNAQGCIVTGGPGGGKATLARQISQSLGRQCFATVATACTTLDHAFKLLRGALHSGGTFCFKFGVDSIHRPETLAMLKALATVVASIEQCVLVKLPVAGLQKDSIVFTPGTALVFAYTPAPSTALSAQDDAQLQIWSDRLCRLALYRPDDAYIVEAWMTSMQFEDPETLSAQLVLVWHQLQALTSHQRPQFTLLALQRIVRTVGLHACQSNEVYEKDKLQAYLLRCAVIDHCTPLVNDEALGLLHDCVDAVFKNSGAHNEWFVRQWKREQQEALAPGGSYGDFYPQYLLDAAHELHLVPRQALLQASMDTLRALTSSIGVVLVGPSGIGKTSASAVLARALDMFKDDLIHEQQTHQSQKAAAANASAEQQDKKPGASLPPSNRDNEAAEEASGFVIRRVVFPMALTLMQLYGSTAPDGRGRTKSLLGRLIRYSQEQFGLVPPREVNPLLSLPTRTPSALYPLVALHKLVWITFDGACDARWMEALHCVLSTRGPLALMDAVEAHERRVLPFQDGEFMTLPPNVRFLFETLDLQHASPVSIQLNAIVAFQGDCLDGVDAASTTDEKSSSPAPTQSASSSHASVGTNTPIHVACIERFLAIQRAEVQAEAASSAHNPTVSCLLSIALVMYEYVNERLLVGNILGTIHTVVVEYGTAVVFSPLERVRHLLMLLQPLLSSVSGVYVAMGAGVDVVLSSDEHKLALQKRVSMVLVYALAWGYACGVQGNPQLQLLISGMLKREFVELAETWETSNGKDVNLFEVLIDLEAVRFVTIDSLPLAKAVQNTRPNVPKVVSTLPNALFVPTASSLLVHAAMKDALRSGHGVLVVGCENARRTTLLRNFLHQIDYLAALLKPATADGGETGTTGADASTSSGGSGGAAVAGSNAAGASMQLASVERIRLHQVMLVKKLAKRFRMVNSAAQAQAAEKAGGKGLKAVEPNAAVVADETPAQPAIWRVRPCVDGSKIGTVEKFDRGDYIPFFFSMNQHDRGVSDLAQCMERMLQRERTGIYEPPPGKTAVFIIDDLHLPMQGAGAQHPSCYEYLRSAYEHASVFAGPEASPVTIESLMMIASIATRAMGTSAPQDDQSCRRLRSRFFPVLAPSCSLQDVHQVFATLVLSRWERASSSPLDRLSASLRQSVATMVAATTVLWEKLRRSGVSRQSFGTLTTATTSLSGHVGVPRELRLNLHDLARVYEGICSVEPMFLINHETLLRLWTHECTRSFADPFQLFGSTSSAVQSEIWRLRCLLQSYDHQRTSTSGVTSKRDSTMSGSGGGNSNGNSMHGAAAPFGNLAYFMTEYLDKRHESSQQQQERRPIPGLWGFVLNDAYFLVSRDVEDDSSSNNSAVNNDAGRRRSSVSLFRRKSMNGSSNTRWMYAELIREDASTEVAQTAIQIFFGSFGVYGSIGSALDSSSAAQIQLKAAQLPRNAPTVSLALATRLAQLERVHGRRGARMLLLGPAGSGREVMIHYLCSAVYASTGPRRPQPIVYFEGLPDATVVKQHWSLLLHELYERVGIDCEQLTLVVKRVDLLPRNVVNQLLSLLASGEIPGAFALEEQIKMATRVRDERLVELENRYHANCTRIRHDWEFEREKALTAMKKDNVLDVTAAAAEKYQEWEQQQYQMLQFRLDQAQLRHQQDLDDFLRTCEVENESVAATIMSLMRPLGMTSGKWQQIIHRLRRRLRIVFLVDVRHQSHAFARVPELFSACDVISLPALTDDALVTIVYGHFHNEFQRLQRQDISEWDPTCKWSEFLVFLERVERDLPRLALLAVQMHRAAVQQVAQTGTLQIPTMLLLMIPAYWTRLLQSYYVLEHRRQQRAQWFLFVHSSMEKELWKLQDGDAELKTQLSDCARNAVTLEEQSNEQRQDVDRIRDMMRRFQQAAEEQVHITNEMEQQAHVELHVPMACLEEANAALLLIDKRHIIEIKSFLNPPPLVHLVFDAISVMFGSEPTWDNAKRILSDSNIVQTLLNFDKDKVSPETLARVEKDYTSDPRFCKEEVEKQSVAASTMVIWVKAICQYARTRRVVAPTLQKLEKAQQRLRLLMTEYQTSKQRVTEAEELYQRTRMSLLATQELKERTVQEIESRCARLEGGKMALDFLQEDKLGMEKEIAQVRQRQELGVVWWNALLTAGVLAHGGQLGAHEREQLYNRWLEQYVVQSTNQGANEALRAIRLPVVRLALREDTDEPDEPDDDDSAVLEMFVRDDDCFGSGPCGWELVSRVGALFSRRHLQDAYTLSELAAARFPVVAITHFHPEMEDVVVKCARSIWKWSNFLMIDSKAPDLSMALRHAVADGHQLLVLDVEPCDALLHHGSLAAIFHWQTTVVAGKEHLIFPRPSLNEFEPPDPVPIHPDFRVLLTSHDSPQAFGDLLQRFPLLDAEVHASDVHDAILDKMWHPGIQTHNQQPCFQLRQTVREFDELAVAKHTASDFLTKLIQEAAVHGDFQIAETERVREASNRTKETRLQLQKKRMELHEALRVVRKHVGFARMGAAIFNGFNRVIAAPSISPSLSSAIATASCSPPLTLQFFLPLFFTALKAPELPTAESVLAEAGRADGSTYGQPPMLAAMHARTSSFRRSSQSLLRSSRASSRTLSVVNLDFNPASETLTQMLARLMPLVPSPEHWQRFLVELITGLEKNQQTRSKTYRNLKVLQQELLLGDAASERQRSQVTSIVQLDDLLLQKKLGVWRATGSLSDDDVHKLRQMYMYADQDDDEVLLSLIVDGDHARGSNDDGDDDDGESEPVLALFPTSRPRSERLKLGLVLFPHLVSALCCRMLRSYGVRSEFTQLQDDATLEQLLRSPGHGFTRSLAGESEHDLLSKKHGWLRVIAGFQEAACVLIVTTQPFASFEFLHRVVGHTIARSEDQLRLLRTLFARGFRSHQQLNDLFVLPHASRQKATLGSAVRSNSHGVTAHSTHLAVQEFVLMAAHLEEIFTLEKEKHGQLETLPLAVVNMQGMPEPFHWEELFQILQRSHQKLTSSTFRRHNSTEGPRPDGIVSTSTRRISSLMTQEHSNNQHQHHASTRTSPRRLSSAMPLLNRLSSDSTLLGTSPSCPRLLSVVEDWHNLPRHLQHNLLCFSLDEGHGRSNSSLHTLQHCVQATLLRFACHPCSDHVQAAVLAEELSKAKALGTAGSDAVEGNMMNIDPTIKRSNMALWERMTSLVLFHAVLTYRSSWYWHKNVDHAVSPSGDYHWNEFTTAMDQLLVVSTQVKQKQGAGASWSARERVLQQVILSAYMRKSRGRYEVNFLRQLYQECFPFVESASGSTSGSAVLGGSNSVVSSSRHVGASSRSLAVAANSNVGSTGMAPHPPSLGVASSSRLLHTSAGSVRNLGGLTSTGSIRNMANASANAVGASNRSLLGTGAGGSTLSLLGGGKMSNRATRAASVLWASVIFPIEELTERATDVEHWLDIVWAFSDTLDTSVETRVRVELLRLPEPTQCSTSSAVGRCAMTGTAQWLEAFGWRPHDPEGSARSQSSLLSLNDALAVLDTLLLRMLPPEVTIPPPSVGNSARTKATIEDEDAPSDACAVLLDVILRQTASAFNTYVSIIRTTLERLKQDLQFWYDHTDHSQQVRGSRTLSPHHASLSANGAPTKCFPLACVDDEAIQTNATQLMHNQVPACVREHHERLLLGNRMLSMQSFVRMYQFWHSFLHRKLVLQQSRMALHWWVPGLFHIQLHELVAMAKQRYCREHGISDDDHHVVFTLHRAQIITKAPAPDFGPAVATSAPQRVPDWNRRGVKSSEEEKEAGNEGEDRDDDNPEDEEEEEADVDGDGDGDGDADDDAEAEDFEMPDHTFLVLEGLTVHGAEWNQDRGYLEHPSATTVAAPGEALTSQLLVIGALEKSTETNKAGSKASSGGHHAMAMKRRKHATRLCPILRGSDATLEVAHEFELPVASTFSALATPYLTLALP
ncbi:TPA: hypothetical protein N0F65_008156 [Lagenidium giganteum]|uniref:Dynein heavy chain n=1 Tax=Lagenidium giganteum TaxID=4803 RepID=A0AAV2YND7_9STRA|nr:TPA: hypothetical protein N0F65_008156 [Lagenidium giganteum]